MSCIRDNDLPYLDQDEILERINIMCLQEDNSYHCLDYLKKYRGNNQYNGTELPTEGCSSPQCVSYPRVAPATTRQQHKPALNANDRKNIVQYSYRVADFCSIPREVVSISMNYFDRFMNTESCEKWLGAVSASQRGTFINLIFMTCLYIAIKMHGPEAIAIEIFAELSHGKFTIEQIEYMEFLICFGLDWRLNPPTELEFVRNFMTLAPKLSDELHEIIIDLARLQVEMALCKYSLVTIPASTIAFGAVYVAIESLLANNSIEDKIVEDTLGAIADSMPNFHKVADKIEYTKSKLCQGIAHSFLHLDAEVAVDDTDDENEAEAAHEDEDPDSFYIYVPEKSHEFGLEQEQKDPRCCSEYMPWPLQDTPV